MGGTRGGAHPADRHTDTQRHGRYRAESQWVVPEAGHTLQTDIQTHSVTVDTEQRASGWYQRRGTSCRQTYSVTVDTEQRASGWYQRRGTSCRQTHRHTQRHSRYRAESQWVVPEAGHTLQTDIQTHSVTVDTEQRASGWYQRRGTPCRKTYRHTASR